MQTHIHVIKNKTIHNPEKTSKQTKQTILPNNLKQPTNQQEATMPLALEPSCQFYF